jgi:tetratricopeptide (TPR) repeat protein
MVRRTPRTESTCDALNRRLTAPHAAPVGRGEAASAQHLRGSAPDPSVVRRQDVLILVAVLAIGGLLRGLYLSEIVKHPDFASPGVDAGYHDYWARALATGNWTPPVAGHDPLIRSTPYFRPPGYAYFLAAVYRLTGCSYVGARFVQMGLGLANCVLALFLARRWYGRAVGLAFAALMSVYWIFIYYEGEFLEPVVLVSLGLLLIYCLALWTEAITFGRSLAAGILLGVFGLVRPNALPFGAVALGWAVWLAVRRGAPRRAWVAVVGLPLGTLCAVAPAAIRNYVVAHEFVLISSNAGINLFLGNNEFAQGRFVNIPGFQRFGTCYDYIDVKRYSEEKSGRPLSYSEVSGYFTREALGYIRRNPAHILGLALTKTLLFWGPVEVGHNKDEHFERLHSRVLRRIPVGFPLAQSLAVMGAAFLLADHRRWLRQGPSPDRTVQTQFEVFVLILLFILSYFASFVPFFVAGQYRVPIIPFLLLLGAYGLVRIGALVRQGRLATAAGAMSLGVVLWLLASVNVAGEQPNHAVWYFQRGAASARVGRTDQAEEAYRQALRLDPNYAEARGNLGILLAQRGALDEGTEQLAEAVRLKPNDARKRCNYGKALNKNGRIEEAVRQFNEAVRLDPHYINPHAELGWLFAGQGKFDEAATHFAAVARLAPADPYARVHLGRALFAQGRAQDAIVAYREAIRLKPDLGMAHYDLATALESRGDYREAWKEVRLSREYGFSLDPGFLKRLAEKMPEPKE